VSVRECVCVCVCVCARAFVSGRTLMLMLCQANGRIREEHSSAQ
jgi:hypothetical protein